MLESRTRYSCLGFLIVVVGLMLAFVLVIPFSRSAREPVRRNQCLHRMREISVAILNYELEHGTLPPAYTVDEEGNRLHSWRTLILPYLDEQALFETIDLTKPWNHPDNAAAIEVIPSVYICPSSPWSEDRMTYVAVDDERCCFNGSTPRKMDEITDGFDRTVLIIEVDEEHAVHWMEPRDVDMKAALSINPEWVTGHNGLTMAAFVDSHCWAFSLDTSVEWLEAALTISGGEVVED